eukprot:s2698_g9.t1
MQDVDRALFNTLRVRFELGLFDPTADQPYWKLGAGDIGTDNAKDLNLEAAQASLVLLSNPGILPLHGGHRLALLGPHAAASMDLIQVDTGAVCPPREAVPKAAEWNGDTGDDENFWCVKSPYAAIQALNAAKNGSTVYVKGCNLSEAIPGGLQQAISAAKTSDVVILGLGISERQEISDNFLEREAHDRDSIDLPNVQKQLAAEIIGLGKPTIIFLLNGGMVAVEEFLNKTNVAVIEAFYPGMEGATALAQSIFGLANKWGRMPYTVYRSDWPNHNSMIDHDVTHQRTYRYGADAVVPFGFGLSLSRFSLSFEPTLKVAQPLVLSSTATSNVTFTVVARNLGSLMGDAVIMAYFHPKQVALPLHPQKSLFDFARAKNIKAGSKAHVNFTVSQNSFLLATAEGDLVRAPGDYLLTFEDGAGEILSLQLQIQGPQVLVEPFPGRSQAEQRSESVLSLGGDRASLQNLVQWVPLGCDVLDFLLEFARKRASKGETVNVVSNARGAIDACREFANFAHLGFMFVDGELLMPGLRARPMPTMPTMPRPAPEVTPHGSGTQLSGPEEWAWPEAMATARCIGPWSVLVLRTLLAASYVGHACYDVITYYDSGFYFMYLTHISLFFQVLYSVFLVAATVLSLRKLRRRDSVETLNGVPLGTVPGVPASAVELRAAISDLKHRSGSGEAPVTVCIALVLFCLQLPLSFMVVFMYWSLEVPIWSLRPGLPPQKSAE